MRSTAAAARLSSILVGLVASQAAAAPDNIPVATRASSASTEAVDLYVQSIKPLLAAKCGACHSAVRQKSGLRLDAGSLIHRGGDSGAALVPGRSANSLLIQRVTNSDDAGRMPPEGEGTALSAAEVELLRQWIDRGAHYPADEAIPDHPLKHWSFQPPVRPQLPEVVRSAWVKNPIDRLIAQEHQRQHLRPQPEADRATLLRRVSLDLTGLPPTVDEVRNFWNDSRPDAYELVVDELLSRPTYGERWARHWMDVWRYCDAHGSGNEIRYSRRYLWHWRDWIVRSINQDHGYDCMLLEMLAADEVAPDDPNTLAATGYLARNWYKFDRQVWMRELVEQTAAGFLGLTLKCARCHDHKFDPVSQEEYYRFRAFFEPHDVRYDRLSAAAEFESFVDGGPVLKDGIARVYDKTLDAPTYLFVRGDDRTPQKDRPLSPDVPRALGSMLDAPQPVQLPLAATAPWLTPARRQEILQQAEQQLAAAETNWQGEPDSALLAKRLELARAEQRSTQARLAADVALHVDHLPAVEATALARTAARQQREAALVRAEVAWIEARQAVAAAQAALARCEAAPPVGKDQAPADSAATAAAIAQAKKAVQAAEQKLAAQLKLVQASRAELTKSDGHYTPLGEGFPLTSTGRRLALARWMTDARNPRTARVAVNQMWLRHFGRPLVETVTDFGLRSKPPSHPELLDYLAVEFVESGWSMKHLHRLMVTSATYRQRSAVQSESDFADQSAAGEVEKPAEAASANSAAPDAENRYLARMAPRQLEAEAIRDSVLFVAGLLDLKLGGPEIPYTQDQAVPRRSLYFQTAPNRQSLLLASFDQASPEECYQRRPSVMPQQSLALLNSQLTSQAADKIAARHEALSDDQLVVALYEAILSRRPTAVEADRCREFLQSQAAVFAASQASAARHKARAGLVLVLLNHNEMLTIR